MTSEYKCPECGSPHVNIFQDFGGRSGKATCCDCGGVGRISSFKKDEEIDYNDLLQQRNRLLNAMKYVIDMMDKDSLGVAKAMCKAAIGECEE